MRGSIGASCFVLMCALAGPVGAAHYPPGPGGAYPDTLTISNLQNPAATPAPAVPDTVYGIRGIVTAIDALPSSFTLYMQNSGSSAYTGIALFTANKNKSGSPTNIAIGDSVAVYGKKQDFQGETEIEGLDNSPTTDDILVRRISAGNPIPPFKVGTTTDFRESNSNSYAEQYEGMLVRIPGPLRVARTIGLGANAFLLVANSTPTDSVFIDGNSLTTVGTPVVGTIADGVRGILSQRTRGYRIQLRSADDLEGVFTVNLINAYWIDDNHVEAVFDRPVTAPSATNPANYSLGSFGSVDAVGMDGSSAARLTVTDPLGDDEVEILTAFGIVASTNGGTMTSPQSIAFMWRKPPCHDTTRVYTTSSDFATGTLAGLVATSGNLSIPPNGSGGGASAEFAWIANANEGTVSKVSTVTGKEVARYYTGPTSGTWSGQDPSRTVVDPNGNCWVANRCFGGVASVTEILASGGGPITSTDLDNNGVISTAEMYPWGQDQRVIRHYRLGDVGSLARGLSFDKNGYLWVALFMQHRVVKLDPNLSTVTYGPTALAAPPEMESVNLGTVVGADSVYFYPYGLALSPSGKIYGSTGSRYAFEIDPAGTPPAMTNYIDHNYSNYGIAVDKDCIVWLARSGTVGCTRWDPSATPVGSPNLGWTNAAAGALGAGRGICVDPAGNIWVACNDFTNSVAKFSNAATPAFIGAYGTTLGTPVGVGVSQDGNIICSGQSSNTWVKLNVNTGANIPLPGPCLTGQAPYSYSDFTGAQLNLTGTQAGTWNVVTDAGAAGFEWKSVNWTKSTPANTSVQIDARAAASVPGLAGVNWTTLSAPGPLTPTLNGRYLETRALLTRTIGGCSAPFVTPLLSDLTVAGVCDTCPLIGCPPDISVICDSPAGKVVNFPTPYVSGPCSPTAATCVPASGSLFPIGNTIVTCNATTSAGQPVSCSFVVHVSGECLPNPTGACCLGDGCTTATQADCLAHGGIFKGDGTSCTGGCDQGCTLAPGNLRAWWPLNSANGNLSPNVADLGAGVQLVGPTLVTGQHVNNSYFFNGINEFGTTLDVQSLALGTKDFTIDAWVKTSQSSDFAPIVDKREPSTPQGYYFFLLNGYPGVQLAISGTTTNYNLSAGNGGAPAFVADGNWHHLAATVKRTAPTAVKIYVDGVQRGTTMALAAGSGTLDNTQSLWMGRSQSIAGSAGYFQGGIDEVEIFDRALRADEVLAMYSAGTQGKCLESCYAPRYVSCCTGSVTFNISISNYTDVSHVYSWGLSPSAGPNCVVLTGTSFNPAANTLTITAHTTVSIPITVICPSALPFGQNGCFKLNVYNHDTGATFGSIGSLHRGSPWCFDWRTLSNAPMYHLGKFLMVQPTTVRLVGQPNEVASVPARFVYRIRGVAGSSDSTSGVLSINGLPPGVPVIDSVAVPANGSPFTIQLNIAYATLQPIGFDRVVVETDPDRDGIWEAVGSLGTYDDAPASPTAVPDPVPGQVPAGTRFLALPNPFSTSTRIAFTLGKKSMTQLMLFDVRGRIVRELVEDEILEAGPHTVDWDGRDEAKQKVPAGVYFLELVTEQGSFHAKVVLNR